MPKPGLRGPLAPGEAAAAGAASPAAREGEGGEGENGEPGNRLQLPGLWLAQPHGVLVRIERQPAGHLDATLAAAPPDRPELDGVKLLTGFRRGAGPGRWDQGEIYDPATGWTVKGRLEAVEVDAAGQCAELRVSGWVGAGPLKVSRRYTWTRVAEAAGGRRGPGARRAVPHRSQSLERVGQDLLDLKAKAEGHLQGLRKSLQAQLVARS